MNQSIIRDIFDAQLGGAEQIETTDAQNKLTCAVLEAQDALVKQLSPAQLQLHQTFANVLDDEFTEEIYHHYVCGFKLGLKIGIECTEK